MDKKILYALYASLGVNVIFLSAILIFIFQPRTIENVPQLNQNPQSQDVYNNEYTQKALNFKIKYPDTLTQPSISMVKNGEDRPDVGHVTLYNRISKESWDACGEKCIEGGPDRIQISIYKNPKKLSPKDWVIENKDAPFIYSNYDYLSQDIETTFVDGRNAVKYSWFGLGGADSVVFTDEKNGLIYMISANYINEKSTIRDDLRQVINSFSLLDQ